MVDKVREYYDSNAEMEWERLNNPYSIVEYKSTLFLIDKYFSNDGSVIDIGSGPGRYSIELLKRGYEVDLLDISQEELNIAKNEIEKLGLKANNYYCKSAIELECFEAESYDNILVMGPMYHLHIKEERQRVLKEVYRILKKDAVAIISYINTWGAIKAAVTEFPLEFDNKNKFERYMNGDLSFSEEESFTKTYFTTAEKALQEVEDVGFEIVSYAGAEGFLSGISTDIKKLANGNKEIYENFINAAVETCELKQYRDATEHINIVVRK
ncbi:methyltransferase domain-containing protein [Clostridium gasigenes]|nr:methyltransferase domain-containing protein [Clostridium gasigenes]